ncbi:cytochrome P450 [Actinocorallia sp. A-T 12471]|uniref:cytochrome P450 n=1 Tax=Actinocorallia sp. A-T 12471 TaxID=3089813 RepID=UPI0029CEB28C|nr:cytochrome P450 [Actinocorallia sp. A-T 12471]MDX6739167.1 cytochrome P450 [Actinocorallia sp. A-T 12471]
MTSADTLLRAIADPASRADPYPLYDDLRRTPVVRQEDGVYTVSTYWEVRSLLNDPRMSSETRPPAVGTPGPSKSFLRLDPAEHDRVRRIVTRPFGPPHTPGRVFAMHDGMAGAVKGLIDAFDGKDAVDVVDDFAYPFPISVICRLFGVPLEDEPRFHLWTESLLGNADLGTGAAPDPKLMDAETAKVEMGTYLAELFDKHRKSPGDDMFSALATDDGPDGRLTPPELVANAFLLLIAGHETTVNLIANGVLTLLRNPDALKRLRDHPDLVVPLVEELLRFEPPVQYLPNRRTLDDIEVCGTVIPRGADVNLMLAAANRDPNRFADPDRFVPDRPDVQHLGFGLGIHYCFGAPLARMETRLALTEFARRVKNPELVADPPPYRVNPVLRGPRHLEVSFRSLKS